MQLMLVNPTKPLKKRKNKMAVKKRRTAKQKAATKKLVALNKRRARKAPARKAPARKRRTVARKRVAVKAPSRRTGRTPTKRLIARRKRNTVKRYYPNPANRKVTLKNVVNGQIKPAAIQASGALALDIGYGYLGGYIPAMLNSGMLRHATKGVIAIGLGMVAGKFIKNQTANALVLGAMTVTMHDAMKEAMQNFMPSIPMGDGGDLGYYNASPVVDMGAYVADNGSGMGYFSDDSGSGFQAEAQPFDTSDI